MTQINSYRLIAFSTWATVFLLIMLLNGCSPKPPCQDEYNDLSRAEPAAGEA